MVKEQRVKKEKRCVSHSKAGLIKRQGGVQHNGSRAAELQIIQDGRLKTGCLLDRNGGDERKTIKLPDNNTRLLAIKKP